MKYETLKAKFLKDPDVRKAHRAMAPEFALTRELIAARTALVLHKPSWQRTSALRNPLWHG
ncbi:MAG: hypothetical protein ACYC7I_13345 [Gammaproteobacteria bacterium]